MHPKQEKVETFLRRHKIPFQSFSHPAVFTVQDSQKIRRNLPGRGGKTLFLKDSHRHRYYLLSLAGTYRADIAKFRRLVKAKKLAFARPEELTAILDLTPGSVSPFGLLNDHDHQVKFYLDKSLAEAEAIAFHPNINTATLVLQQADFRRFLALVHHPVHIVNIAILGEDALSMSK